MHTFTRFALLCAAAGVAAITACGDGALAPTAAPQPRSSVIRGSRDALSQLDTVRFTFVIDPSQVSSTYLGAGNSLYVPAHALCDVAKSTYGPTEWDKPCTAATAPLTVSAAAWLDASGHPRVDFTPSLRFVPTDDPAGWVNIVFTDDSAADQPMTSILYCPSTGAACYDEAVTDPTQVTIKDPTSGILTRRIKHFSGYNVGAGDDSSGYVGSNSRAGFSAHASFDFLGLKAGLQNLNVLGLRRTRSTSAVTASATIGPMGGTLSLPNQGLSLFVPPGAVQQPTKFQATAIGGSLVAYSFEPHGSTFPVPLLFRQSLQNTDWFVGVFGLMGAYFQNASQLDQNKGSAQINELLNIYLNPFNMMVTIPIHHFSGYMLAVG